MGDNNGVMIGRRAGGNCVLCQNKSRQKVGLRTYSYCVAFGSGTEAISKYFHCKYQTDPGQEGNAFKMIKGGKWK